MPGQMGRNKVTVQNLDVVKVDTDREASINKGAITEPEAACNYKETVKR